MQVLWGGGGVVCAGTMGRGVVCAGNMGGGGGG